MTASSFASALRPTSLFSNSKEFALKTYQVMLKNRLADEKMKKLVRQNKGGSFHLSTQGHEMIGAITGLLLTPQKDYAFPYYRDRTFAIGLGCELKDLFATFLARNADHHSMGRMMPEHFSHKSLRIPCQSSVVGSQFLHAVGTAKACKMLNLDEIVYVSAGDGATSQGDFHEALNFSSIHQLPVVFCIQDNQLAISVPAFEQTAGKEVSKLIHAFPGVEIFSFDGTDFEMTLHAVETAYLRARKGQGPSVLIAKVPRLGAHSSSDDPTKYLTQEEVNETLLKDPITRLEKYLTMNFFIAYEELEEIRRKIFQEVEMAAEQADLVPHPDPKTVLDYVYYPHEQKEHLPVGNSSQEPVVMVDAINHAIEEAMSEDEGIVVFGQDVAHGKGGVFGITRYLTEKFGNRCFNTPLAESTIMGLALGMSLTGKFRPIAEIQFADYIWTGINQLFNEIASFCYRSNGEWNVPVVIRMPIGGYIQGGPYHSQSIEAYLAHCPGLKIVFPSNAFDAKCLMKAAIKDPNPVIFLEHKGLYRQRVFSAQVEPSKEAILPIGKGKIVKAGKDVTLITWGMLTVMGHEITLILEKEGFSVELIDLRTIIPFDEELVIESVKKTGKLIVAHEAPKTCGFSAEIIARINEKCFSYLDAPMQRVCGLDAPIAYSKILEDANLPQKNQLLEAVRKLLKY
jgi:2-oxoisovalerate dehydrogenase E1 component